MHARAVSRVTHKNNYQPKSIDFIPRTINVALRFLVPERVVDLPTYLLSSTLPYLSCCRAVGQQRMQVQVEQLMDLAFLVGWMKADL